MFNHSGSLNVLIAITALESIHLFVRGGGKSYFGGGSIGGGSFFVLFCFVVCFRKNEKSTLERTYSTKKFGVDEFNVPKVFQRDCESFKVIGEKLKKLKI